MDIALYISELLQKHDEISIAGLGTFFKKNISARYDDQRESYLPPAQQVEFKPDYRPDTRLAEYISEQRNLSLASSEHFIEKFTEDIHSQINNQQAAEIAHLGILRKTDGNFTFAPSAEAISGNSYFGLQPVKELKKPLSSPANWDPVILNELPELSDDQGTDEPVKRRKFPVAAVIIITLLAGVAALFFFSPDTIQYLTKSQVEAPVKKTVIPAMEPKTLADSLSMADSIIQSLDQQGFDVEKPRDTLKVSTQAIPAGTPEITYEVIGASLNSQADAERLVRNFKAKGIDARIIMAKDKKRNNILISLGSFNNKPAASTELIRIKNDIEPGAYIYTYNKNL